MFAAMPLFSLMPLLPPAYRRDAALIFRRHACRHFVAAAVFFFRHAFFDTISLRHLR